MTTIRSNLGRGAAILSVALLLPAANATAQDDAVPVTVTHVLESDIAPRVPAAGTVYSRNETAVTAGIAGRIQWVAEPGLFIRSGEAVARFDCEMLELQRERQVAEAERAQINFETLKSEVVRLESLEEQSVIAEIELDRTRAERDLAGSDLSIAEITIRETESLLGRCTVRAPFSGVVTERLQRGGEDVERSTVLARMTDINNLEVRASVPIRYLPRMRVGGIADVSMNDLELEGRVRSIVPAANSQSQTFEVRLDLPEDAPSVVAAGQLVSVGLPLAANPALTVPRDSVVLREDGTFVMRITDEALVEQVAVEVGESSGDSIAVRGPLESGDTIAVRGAEALDDGALVVVMAGG